MVYAWRNSTERRSQIERASLYLERMEWQRRRTELGWWLEVDGVVRRTVEEGMESVKSVERKCDVAAPFT